MLPDEIATKSAGGVILTETLKAQEGFAVCTGTLVAVGGASFSDWPHSDKKWPGTTPAVGDRVHIAKFAGIVISGKDGRDYRLIQDVDVAGMETS